MTQDSYVLSKIKEYARHERNRGWGGFRQERLKEDKIVMLGRGGAFNDLLDLIDELEGGNKKRSLLLQRL